MTLLSGYGVNGWEEKNPYRGLVEKPLGKGPLGRPRIRQGDRKMSRVRLGIRCAGNCFRILSGQVLFLRLQLCAVSDSDPYIKDLL